MFWRRRSITHLICSLRRLFRNAVNDTLRGRGREEEADLPRLGSILGAVWLKGGEAAEFFRNESECEGGIEGADVAEFCSCTRLYLCASASGYLYCLSFFLDVVYCTYPSIPQRLRMGFVAVVPPLKSNPGKPASKQEVIF